jgi:hypothetical protein
VAIAHDTEALRGEHQPVPVRTGYGETLRP